MKSIKVFKSVVFQKRCNHSSSLSVSELIKSYEDENFERVQPYKNIPGPKPLPFIGNTWRFIPFIGDFKIEHIDKISKKLYETYGNVVKMEGLIGRPDMLFLFDPDEIEKVFRQEDTMPLRPSMPSLNFYKHVLRKEFFGNEAGVIAVHGPDWQNFRSKVNQIMMQPRTARMYIKTIETAAEDFLKRIQEIKSEKQEMPDDFLNEIHKWSLESIARVALDVRLGCFDKNSNRETQTLINAVNTFFINVPILELKVPFWKLFNTPTFLKYIQALDTITDITMGHVNKALKNLNKKADQSEKSVLQRVLEIDNESKIATILALDMFLVGIDTTSNAVASILYQLAIHPEKQELLHEEIERVLPDRDTLLDNDKLEQMTYLKACIKETMRMFPVVIGNGRCTTRDCIIGGYQVPKGVQVVFQHYVISNLDKYFERSNEFIPERWLKTCNNGNKDGTISKNHHPFASLPFGYGRRMCLGKRFADLEIQTVIAKVLRKIHRKLDNRTLGFQIIQSYKIEYHHKKLDYYIHPMYTPNGPLKLAFLKR